jgi:excisionase family DNA binding protein
MVLMTTKQAADRLGVSARHVQRLVAEGALAAIGTDRIDADSVAHWLVQRQGSRVRAWEEPTAWAAVALLEGRPASWLGQAQRSRLKAVLTDSAGDELAARCRNRAQIRRYRAHTRALSHVEREVVGSGATDGVGGLSTATDRADGYVDHSAADRLVRRYRLEPDPGGNVTLRITGTPLAVVEELASGGRHVLAGLDLTASTDARERTAGRRLLERAVAALRG